MRVAADVPNRILCPILVGRESELAALGAILAEVRVGHGRVAIIGGDAGIGKSRLLDTFLAAARASGARVVSGQCVEAEARRPFGPFIDALAEIGHSAALLSSGRDPAIVDADARFRALRSFAGVLADVARDSSLVVAIEDLHWADEGTLELFGSLARILSERPILLIGTYRTDELHRLHPLRTVLANLARARLADALTLGRLTRDDTSALVHATLGEGTTRRMELLDALESRCEGNPFFVEEVLKALVEAGHLVYRDRVWHEGDHPADLVIPASIRDAVQDRLALLPQQAREVVQTAAVIGTFFDYALLAQISHVPDDDLTAALRKAIDAQLIAEIPGRLNDTFRFRHALTRESVLSELLGRERRVLHATIAATLRRTSERDPDVANEELAYHFDEAGDRDEAFRYHELAARRAERLFAFGPACRHLERALELASKDADIAELELRLSRAAVGAGDGRRALRAAESARTRFAERKDTSRVGLALCALFDANWFLGQAEEARRADQAAIEVLEPLGPTAELGEAYRRMTQMHVQNDEPTVDPHAQRAIELGRQLGLAHIEAWGLLGLGRIMVVRGESAGVELLEHALKIGLDQDSPSLTSFARISLMTATTKLGRPPAERRSLYEAMVEHAARLEHRDDLLLVLMVEESIADGEFDRANRLALQVPPDSMYGAESVLRIALVHAARTGACSMKALDSARARLVSSAFIWRAFAATSAQPLLLMGEARKALEHLDPAADRIARGSRRKPDEVAAICAIEAARRLADPSALTRWVEVALGNERAVESRARRASRAFAGAERAHQQGMLDRAIELSTLSVEHIVGDQWPFIETLARLRHAELLVERGTAADLRAAKAELGAVVAFWRRAGATWYLGKLRAWAREHHLTLPPVVASQVARSALTRREREIAYLVADGLSNPQIAARLVISARTAESHVQRIMEKLAMHSRAEVAVWAAAARRP